MAPWRAPIPANDAKAHELQVFGDDPRVTLRGSSPRASRACTETQGIHSVWAVLAVPVDIPVTNWCPDKTVIFVPTRSNSKVFRDFREAFWFHFRLIFGPTFEKHATTPDPAGRPNLARNL